MNTAKTGWRAAFAMVAAALAGVSAVTAMSSTSGCAAIVGADDYKVGSGSGGGAGVATGTGGTAGAGNGLGGSVVIDAATGAGGVAGSAGAATGLDAGRDAAVADARAAVADARADAPTPAPDAPQMPAGAGETACTSTCAPGLSCVHGQLGMSGICSYSCARNADCAADHQCLQVDMGASFPASCFKTCSNRVCPGGLFCWVEDSDPGSCSPTDWGVRGLGDDCTADSQCVSGLCTNKPNGWCSLPCTAADLCEHYPNTTDYYTNHDEVNWCVLVGAAYACAPSCANAPSDCSFYPGTICRTVTDADGASRMVCIR